LEDAEEDTEAEDDHEESSETEASSLITEGPSRVVDLILRLTNSSRILELIGKPNYSEDVFVPSIMMLQPYESLPIRPILTSPGIGLTLKRNNHNTEFLLRDYRYLNYPQEIKKGKAYLVLSLHHKQNLDLEEICGQLKIQKRRASRYIQLYENNTKNLQHFMGKHLNVGLTCQLFAAFNALHV